MRKDTEKNAGKDAGMDAVVVGLGIVHAINAALLVLTSILLGFILALWAVSVYIIYRRLPTESWNQLLAPFW